MRGHGEMVGPISWGFPMGMGAAKKGGAYFMPVFFQKLLDGDGLRQMSPSFSLYDKKVFQNTCEK